jgi:hypothetical protein
MLPSRQRLAQPQPGRAVPMAVDLVRLQQLARVPEAQELLHGQELVAHAVDLAGPAGPGRAGHDVVVRRPMPAPVQRFDDRVFADPGRSGDDHEHGSRVIGESVAAGRLAHRWCRPAVRAASRW